MSDDRATPAWPPALFAAQMQRASEELTEQQRQLFDQWMQSVTNAMGGQSPFAGFSGLEAMSRQAAVFKTRVQSGGRLSIPDAEREALGIEEGDIVQTYVVPLSRSRGGGDE